MNIVSVGDSAIWGQGLSDEDKSSSLASSMIADYLNHDVQHVNFARSGAVISELPQNRYKSHKDQGDFEPPISSTELAIPSPYDDFVSEVPHPTPTILQQVTRLGEPVPAVVDEDPVLTFGPGDGPGDNISDFKNLGTLNMNADECSDVDIVILDGGINDVNGQNVLMAKFNEAALTDSATENHYSDMLVLLNKIRSTFPNALIVLCGYQRILSFSSDLGKAQTLFKDLLVEAFPEHSTDSELISYMTRIREDAINLHIAFDPIYAATVDVINKSKYAAAALLLQKFGPKHVRHAEYHHSRQLAELRRAVSDFLISGPKHPLGGSAIFFADPAYGLDQAMFGGDSCIVESYPTNDSVSDERKFVCSRMHNTNWEYHLCTAAPLFHPNKKGAERLAKAIFESTKKYYDGFSLSNVFSSSEQQNMMSVREKGKAWNLPNVFSLGQLSNLEIVDVLEIELTTSEKIQDAMVVVHLSDSLQFPIREYFPNSPVTNRIYTVDPNIGKITGRLKISEIEKIDLARMNGGNHSWIVNKASIRVNGHEIHTTSTPFSIIRSSPYRLLTLAE